MDVTPQATAAARARLEQLLGDYESLRKNLSATQRRMRALSGRAQTSDGSVKVAVDSRGKPTELDIDPKAYRRYSPSQLGAEILRLIDEAGREVAAGSAKLLAPFLPAGADVAGLVDGTAGPETWSVAAPLTDDTYDSWRARFSGVAVVDPEE